MIDNVELRKKLDNIYQGTLDTSLVEYKGNKEKIILICPKHGQIELRYDRAISGKGCPKCKSNFTDTTEFIKKAFEIHGSKYSYTKVVYKKSSEKVCIICPIHGEFWQTPNSHLNGRGCPKCKGVSTSIRCNKGRENFIKEAIAIHRNKYDYSSVEYINNRTKVNIICPIHGEFWQTPSHHLSGEGCPICRYDKNREGSLLTNDEFILRARKLHGFKYDYSKVDNKGYDEYVTIGCPIHGYFLQTPDSHLHSGGCPKCGATLSKNEEYIKKYLDDRLGENNVIERDRTIIRPKEIDIFIPAKNVGIEFNGLYWHSEKNPRMNKNYHLKKMIDCKNKGIKLIQIFEDEYTQHKEIVLSKLSHILQISDGTKIYGRKCEVKEIAYREAETFLNKNHIQGFASATVYLGAFYEKKLIGVMTFLKVSKTENKWELNRFATDIDKICCGIGGKIFSYFLKKYGPQYIKSFADRRWTVDEDNNFYTRIGFKMEKILPPDYKYYNEKVGKYNRVHKFNFRKQILHKKYGLPLSMTEAEMTKQLGYTKIWDCGLIKYVWKNENN